METIEAIEALKRALPAAHFALRGSPEYEELLDNNFYQSGLLSDIAPACIVQPTTAEEVSTFVKIIKPFALSAGGKAKVRFAIVGQGQQPAPGCSNIEDGITLSLNQLKGINVIEGKDNDIVVQVSAGEGWGRVYAKLDPIGRSFSGGRSYYRSGIGGLALAGGLSFFSSREGFICDNVLNFEVVLASGSIVNANANENADLWVALRGGGNNLGIVTRFDFRTFEQGEVYGGSVKYYGSIFPRQIEALVTELQKPDASQDTHLMLSLEYSLAKYGPDTWGRNMIYCTQGIDMSPLLEPFSQPDPLKDLRNDLYVRSLADAADEQGEYRPLGKRSIYMTTTVKADIATLQAATDLYEWGIEPLKSCRDIFLSLTLEPYSLSLLQKSATQGGNVLGLEPTLGPLVSVLLLAFWESREDDERILTRLRETLDEIDRDAAGRGTLVPFKYLNYAADFQDPIGSYGDENVLKLRNASKRYDPDGLFQKGVPGGWKLFT